MGAGAPWQHSGGAQLVRRPGRVPVRKQRLDPVSDSGTGGGESPLGVRSTRQVFEGAVRGRRSRAASLPRADSSTRTQPPPVSWPAFHVHVLGYDKSLTVFYFISFQPILSVAPDFIFPKHKVSHSPAQRPLRPPESWGAMARRAPAPAPPAGPALPRGPLALQDAEPGGRCGWLPSRVALSRPAALSCLRPGNSRR